MDNFVDELPIKVIAGTGSDSRSFFVHAHLLRTHSTIILKDQHDEPEDQDRIQEICIPDVTPHTFNLVIGWLYNGSFARNQPALSQFNIAKKEPVDSERDDEEKDEDEDVDDRTDSVVPEPSTTPSPPNARGSRGFSSMEPSKAVSSSQASHSTPADDITPGLTYRELLDIYFFAQSYDFPGLRLETIKSWQQLDDATKTLPGKDLVQSAFTILAKDDVMRALMAHQYAFHHELRGGGTDDHELASIQSLLSDLPSDFLIEYHHHVRIMSKAKIEAEINKTRLEYKHSWCKFHGHKNNRQAISACVQARAEENEMKEMRKRKHTWRDADLMLRRVKRHKKVLDKMRDANYRKTIANIPFDEDGLLCSMPE